MDIRGGGGSGGGAPGGGDVSVSPPYNAPALSVVLDAVYLSGSNTVDRAEADGVGTYPAIGFIRTKPTATTATIQYSGEMDGFVGLTPGATYFLGLTPGAITTDVSLHPPGSVVQRVGVARDADTLLIEIDRDFVLL